jgi:hypothetical protein
MNLPSEHNFWQLVFELLDKLELHAVVVETPMHVLAMSVDRLAEDMLDIILHQDDDEENDMLLNMADNAVDIVELLLPRLE